MYPLLFAEGDIYPLLLHFYVYIIYMTNNVSRKRGKPAGGVSLITVPMQDVMNACNASALVTIGRVWGEKMGIIKEGTEEKQERIIADSLFD